MIEIKCPRHHGIRDSSVDQPRHRFRFGTRPIRRKGAVPTEEAPWKSIMKTTGLIGLVCSLVFCSRSLVAFGVFLASPHFRTILPSEQKCNRRIGRWMISYGVQKGQTERQTETQTLMTDQSARILERPLRQTLLPLLRSAKPTLTAVTQKLHQRF
jgi:hypothetical protein